MRPIKEPTVEELRLVSEASRQALATTVGELRDAVSHTVDEVKTRASPAYIKREIKDYVRGERESFIQTVRQKAKDNPLQTAALGAAVAIPALQLLRALPTPLLLFGAGLFLTTKRGQAVVKGVREQADSALEQGMGQLSGAATAIQDNFQKQTEKASNYVAGVKDELEAKTESLADQAQATFRASLDTAKTISESAQEKLGLSSTKSSAPDRLQSNSGPASDMRATEWAGDAARRTKNSLGDFVQQNPLLIAGLSAVVGAVIAASLPPSGAEDRMFGSAKDHLKRKTEDLATQGLEKARELATEAASTAAAAAAREGLDAEGIRKAVRSVAGSAQKVADRGLNATFGSKDEADQSIDERNPT